MIRRSLVLVLAIAAAPSVVGGEAEAVVISRSAQPLPQQQVRTIAIPPALAWHAVPNGPHTFFGVIKALHGNLMIVERRNGRLQSVNPAAAIAHGDVSTPLFVGKFVSVDGRFVGGTFVAAHIFRLHGLDGLPNDR